MSRIGLRLKWVFELPLKHAPLVVAEINFSPCPGQVPNATSAQRERSLMVPVVLVLAFFLLLGFFIDSLVCCVLRFSCNASLGQVGFCSWNAG